MSSSISVRTSSQSGRLLTDFYRTLGVISDPDILAGKPVIKGSRVPVALILVKLAGGMSIEEVTYEYYISLADVRAALGYAAQRLAEEIVYVTKK